MGGGAVVTEASVRTALDGVIDPHMNISINEMQMVRGIEISPEGDVEIGLAFPCIGCPAWTMMQNDVREAVAAVEGTRSVKVAVRWDAPWRKSDLSQTARERIRSFGYQIFPMD